MFAAWRTGWRLPRLWAGLAIFFGLSGAGPFRSRARHEHPRPRSVGLSFAMSRSSVSPAHPGASASSSCWRLRFSSPWPCAGSAGVGPSGEAGDPDGGALLLFELLPSPRPLYSAEIPRIYRYIAEVPGDVRVLELPSGIRDGTQSVGNFTARTQFFQTAHEKRLIGGYLSRVSRRRRGGCASRSDGRCAHLVE